MSKLRPVLYSQSDPKWGKVSYTIDADPDNLINSGCGPTSMAMIVTTLTGKKVIPPDLSKLSLEHGDRTADTGTSWAFFQHVVEHFAPLKCKQTASIDEALKEVVKPNVLVVCSMRPGDFTKGGHFIVMWNYDPKTKMISVNDPAGKLGAERSAKLWPLAKFAPQCKQFWIITK